MSARMARMGARPGDTVPDLDKMTAWIEDTLAQLRAVAA